MVTRDTGKAGSGSMGDDARVSSYHLFSSEKGSRFQSLRKGSERPGLVSRVRDGTDEPAGSERGGVFPPGQAHGPRSPAGGERSLETPGCLGRGRGLPGAPLPRPSVAGRRGPGHPRTSDVPRGPVAVRPSGLPEERPESTQQQARVSPTPTFPQGRARQDTQGPSQPAPPCAPRLPPVTPRCQLSRDRHRGVQQPIF